MDSSFQQNLSQMDSGYNYSQYDDFGDALLETFVLCGKGRVKTLGRVFLPVSYSLICILSIFCNALLILISMKPKPLPQTFPTNVVISDILFATTLPFWAAYAHKEWMFGATACKAISAIYTTSLYSSILFITYMCVDKYISVVWTLAKRNPKTPVKDVIVCSAVWALSLLAASPHWTFAEMQEFGGQRVCTYNFEKHYDSPWEIFLKFQFNIFGFLIPLIVMCFCCTRVCCVVGKLKLSKKPRAPQLFLIPVGTFIVLWLPYNVVYFLHALQRWHTFADCTISTQLDFAIQFTECIAFSHCFINPFLFALLDERVWRRLSKICGRIMCKKNKDYSLEKSDGTDTTSVYDGPIELKAVQNHLEIITSY